MLECLIPIHVMIMYQIAISYDICIYIYIGQCHFDQKHSDQVGTLSFCQSLDRTRAWETTICRIEPPSINQNIHPIQATLYYNKIWVEWSGVHAYTTASVKCKALMNQIPCLLPLAPYRPYRLHVLPAPQSNVPVLHLDLLRGLSPHHRPVVWSKYPAERRRVRSESASATFSSWWLNQPIWKIWVKMGIFPR